MSDDDRLAELLSITAEAHHRAFNATDGFDPDWPAWYANHLLANGFERLIDGVSPAASELAGLLREADRRYRAEAKNESWQSFYAQLLRDRFMRPI